MEPLKRKYIKTRLKFRYALRGFIIAWKTQKSLRYEIFIGVPVNLLLRDYTILLLSCMIVSLELVNTAIERMCNFVHPRYNKLIGMIKDIAAASVGFMCIIAILIGVLKVIERIQ